MLRNPLKLTSLLRSTLPGSWRSPPPDPQDELDRCAASAKRWVDAYRKRAGLNRPDAVSNLLHDIMWLCDRDRRYGDFDEKLQWAYSSYEDPAWWLD